MWRIIFWIFIFPAEWIIKWLDKGLASRKSSERRKAGRKGKGRERSGDEDVEISSREPEPSLSQSEP
jgi:hypothetical protein